ncbi:MAG TPA: PAS domain S-box protein, partial [Candidatus Omnitrophota bacterium]|nr:PAS domain S-box protein [Candidatus Omnitrophota bacterium]
MIAGEIKFKELIDNLKVGVFRSSPGLKGKFLFVNAAFREMLGYNTREIFKIPVEFLLEDPRKFKSILKRIRAHGFVEKEQIRLKRKDRRVFWCSMTWVAVKEKNGRTKYLDVVIEDIALQKHIEKELNESKELFRVVFDNSAAAITVIDKDEKIMAWNPFAEKMLEMNKKDLFNKPIRELYPPEEWRRLRSLRIRHKGMLSDIETRIYKKDKSLLDVNMSISVLKNTSGHFYGAIGIMRDITNQKIAERRIKESENKIRIILDNSAAAITLTDENERIVSWNSYTEHFLGYKRKDLYLMPVSSLYPPQEWAKIRSENIRKTGSKHHLQTKVILKNGRVMDIDLSINVLKDTNGNILGSVGIMQDITEQRQFQQMLLKAKLAAEEANSAKSFFLANMSHEVRTPMSTIMGMLDLTLDTQLSGEQKDNLEVAKDAADNLLSLLNDILDLSRVEAGKINLECIEFSLPNIVQSICKGLSVLARNKDLELTWQIDPRVPKFLQGDPIRVRQVLVNLINNAIKFTSKGKIETRVKASSISSEECQLLFSVTDTGIGIPKDKQEVIFDAFTQADDSTTRRYGGTGLGLAISKRLVEMMAGRIWVESEESKGSTFFFSS